MIRSIAHLGIVAVSLGAATMTGARACQQAPSFGLMQARAAGREGAALAAEQPGYAIAPWLLYQSHDPRSAVHRRAGIDAVIVETPYERVRYEAFLRRIQGLAVSDRVIQALWKQSVHRYGFVVYAHSRAKDDSAYFARFRPARVAGRDGTTVRSDRPSIFGPTDGVYTVGDLRDFRLTAALTFRFARPPNCTPAGRFILVDGYGQRSTLPFDLSRYR